MFSKESPWLSKDDFQPLLKQYNYLLQLYSKHNADT